MKTKISKIAAARAQLGTAIRLWFHDGDLSSMHVLAFSAHQIVADINSAQGGKDLVYDWIGVRDKYRSLWIKTIKAPYNFLKHADHDPDPNAEIELSHEVAEFFIFFTCLGLELMGYQCSAEEAAFKAYFMLNHPELLLPGKDPFPGLDAAHLSSAQGQPKELFFKVYLQVWKPLPAANKGAGANSAPPGGGAP